MNTPASPRPGLREVGPYDSPQLDVAVRLNTNECPLPLPMGFSDDLAAAVRELPLNRYPDGQMLRLREALAARTGHGVDGVWTANGSNETLTQLLMAYGGAGRRAALFEPTYLLHRRLCWLTQTEIAERRLDPPFALDEDVVAWAGASGADVVFVCSPNNPTGNTQSLETIARLSEETPALVIVDEAYVDFGGETALPLVAAHPNVAVVRTFSKAFALAGARIGYVLASPSVVGDLERVRLPYHMSALTQVAGLTALRHADEAAAGLNAIRAERDRIVRALSEIDGATVFPSQANFVLFQPPGDAKELWRGLLEKGVLIRDLTDVVPNGLRVTAGTTHEVDLFLKALEEVLT
ncbi:MAG TPA: histidinol-phosphate transaminase [Actinomycetota bacterium]|nr:histidinol-phosphate transaminase [Actinomycetota bacterium]